MHLQELQSLFQQCVLEGRSGIEAELTDSRAKTFQPASLPTRTATGSRLLEALRDNLSGNKGRVR